MHSEAERFANDMINGGKPRWLTLLGSNGAGKTMLAKIINRIFRQYLEGRIKSEDEKEVRRYHGRFIKWRSMAASLREQEYRLFDDLCEEDFLAVDDIASEYWTDFLKAKLSEFADRRLGKWTVFNANISVEQVAELIDPRIASRMIRDGSTVVDVSVPDYNVRTGEGF